MSSGVFYESRATTSWATGVASARGGGLALLLLSFPPALAASFHEQYIPPEIVYAHDLAQKVPVSSRVNLNTAGLEELKSLPELSESLALKLMRIRPLKQFEDFYELPWISPREIQLLIDSLKNRVEF